MTASIQSFFQLGMDVCGPSFFCPELAVLLGNMASISANPETSDDVGSKVDIGKIAETINNTLRFVSLSPNLDVYRCRQVLCCALHSLLGEKEDDEDLSEKHEKFTTATYLRKLIPRITLSNFVQIVISCDFFKEAGFALAQVNGSEMETFFQTLLEQEMQYDVDSVCSFLWSRWMFERRCTEENVEEDILLVKKLFKEFSMSDLWQNFDSRCIQEIVLLEEKIKSDNFVAGRDREEYFIEYVYKVKHVHGTLEKNLTAINEVKGAEDCGKFYYMLYKACFLHGCISLISHEDLVILKENMEKIDNFSASQFAQISIRHRYSDSIDQFCSLLRRICAMHEYEQDSEALINVISENFSSFLHDEIVKETIRLTLTPCRENPCRNVFGSSFNSTNVVKIRSLLFQYVKMVAKDSINQTLCEFYDHLFLLDETQYREWSENLTEVCDLNESRLTEIFNKLNRKDLEDESAASFAFLLKSSFVSPDQVIERAVSDAVASRGKTMLVEQLLQKLPSLLTFSLRKAEGRQRIPFVISAFSKANVSNVNSACQFLQFLAGQNNIDADDIFTHALTHKMTQNKVNAVKLLVTIAPHVKNEKRLYISFVERFFVKQPQTSLDVDNEWIKKLQLIGFEEFKSTEILQHQDNFFISFRSLLLKNGSDKFNTLTAFFDICGKKLIQKNYDLEKVVITEVPEFFTYHQNEVVVCAYKYIRKHSTLDSRSFALCLKMLFRESLIKPKQGVPKILSNMNLLIWKAILDLIKLCLACDNALYPTNFIDQFMTIVKGVLKWLHQDVRSEKDEVRRQYLLLCFSAEMLSDVLLCSCLTLEHQPQNQVVFRDAFYLLIDQVHNYSRVYTVPKSDGVNDVQTKDVNGLHNSIEIELTEINTLIRKISRKVVVAAMICNYSLPSIFEMLQHNS